MVNILISTPPWRSECDFQALMSRAETMRLRATDPVRAEWYGEYMRGLSRAHDADGFGTQSEPYMWLAAADVDDATRMTVAGYRAGLALEEI